MTIWEKILLYPLGLLIRLIDGVQSMGKKCKPAVAMLMAVVMLCGMLTIMVTAAGWDGITVLGFNYGDDGFLSITAPSTVGNYTYGTANGDTAAETAANQSVLPESGWQWALKRESSKSYRLLLNDFNITYSGNDDIMMSVTDLIIELRGSNSLVKTNPSAGGSGIASDMGCTLSITGEGSLNVAGCSYAIYTHVGSTLTIESGNVTLGASYSTIYASKVELGEYVTAQSSLNSNGSNPSSFASGSRPGNYKWFQTVTNIPEYTLTFDANGGTGTMADVTGIRSEYTLPANGFTALGNDVFVGWLVKGEKMLPGATITLTEDTTISAIWEDKTNYDLWVGGVRVNNGNAYNITGEGISGSISYDAATNTLTLNNATVTGHYMNSGIRANSDLTIVLIGDNSFIGQYNNGSSNYGIYANANLTVIGDGTLTATAAECTNTNSWSVAIYVYKKLTVGEGCIITATGAQSTNGTSAGIYCGDVKVDQSSMIMASTNGSVESAVRISTNSLTRYRYVKISPIITYTVTVTNGTGGGNFEAGSSVVVTADAPASGKQFKEWTGTDGLTFEAGSATDATITFTMPENSVTLVAVYEDHYCTNLTEIKEQAPTCEDSGKEAYYECPKCGKFYEDSNATTEITNLNTWGIIDALDHTPSDWKIDGTYHWKECTADDCGIIIDGSKEKHTSTGNNVADCENAAVCDVCHKSYGTKNDHTPSDWKTDGTYHWKECTADDCGIIIDGSKEKHTSTGDNVADCKNAAVCDVCDKTYGDVTDHTPTNEVFFDKDNHWNVCSCGEKLNVTAHDDADGDGNCAGCDYVAPTPTPTPTATPTATPTGTPSAGGNKPSQTGDNGVALLFTLLIVCGIGVTVTVSYRKKREF